MIAANPVCQLVQNTPTQSTEAPASAFSGTTITGRRAQHQIAGQRIRGELRSSGTRITPSRVLAAATAVISVASFRGRAHRTSLMPRNSDVISRTTAEPDRISQPPNTSVRNVTDPGPCHAVVDRSARRAISGVSTTWGPSSRVVPLASVGGRFCSTGGGSEMFADVEAGARAEIRPAGVSSFPPDSSPHPLRRAVDASTGVISAATIARSKTPCAALDVAPAPRLRPGPSRGIASIARDSPSPAKRPDQGSQTSPDSFRCTLSRLLN